MNLSRILKLAACLVLDLAVILGFLNFFSLFTLLNPTRSIIMLFVLLVGLALWNLVILAPRAVVNKLGVAYSTFVLSAIVIYPLVAIFSTVWLREQNTIWYFIIQLLIAFVFIIAVAIVVPFGKVIEVEKEAREQVAAASDRLDLLLMQIDDMIEEHSQSDSFIMIREKFNLLKERIHASTSFAKMNQKIIVSEMEREIIDELHKLYQRVKPEQEQNVVAIQATMDHIHQLVKHREQLLIK